MVRTDLCSAASAITGENRGKMPALLLSWLSEGSAGRCWGSTAVRAGYPGSQQSLRFDWSEPRVGICHIQGKWQMWQGTVKL